LRDLRDALREALRDLRDDLRFFLLRLLLRYPPVWLHADTGPDAGYPVWVIIGVPAALRGPLKVFVYPAFGDLKNIESGPPTPPI